MTEEEAKTKWCPMSRNYDGGEPIPYNRHDEYIPENCNCIASDCMMWRWMESFKDDPKGGFPDVVSDQEGYCGLGVKL